MANLKVWNEIWYSNVASLSKRIALRSATLNVAFFVSVMHDHSVTWRFIFDPYHTIDLLNHLKAYRLVIFRHNFLLLPLHAHLIRLCFLFSCSGGYILRREWMCLTLWDGLGHWWVKWWGWGQDETATQMNFVDKLAGKKMWFEVIFQLLWFSLLNVWKWKQYYTECWASFLLHL